MEPKHKNHTYSKKAPTASKSGVQKRVTLPHTGRTPSAHSTSAYGNASRAAHGVGGGVKSAAVVIRPWQIILSVLVVLTLVVGGVASSTLLRRQLQQRLAKQRAKVEVMFGQPQFSADNAAGVAAICMNRYLEQQD